MTTTNFQLSEAVFLNNEQSKGTGIGYLNEIKLQPNTAEWSVLKDGELLKRLRQIEFNKFNSLKLITLRLKSFSRRIPITDDDLICTI